MALAIAAVMDVRTLRIPNWLTFSLLAVGIAAQASTGEGLAYALKGAGIAFALHFVLWQMKLEGAGDAKLMMGVGALVGWPTMLEATLWRYILLLPYAIVAITVLRRWQNFFSAVLWTMSRARGLAAGPRPEAAHMPFGPLIAVAVPCAVYSTWLDLVK